MFVGSSVPFAPSSVPFGTPWTEQGPEELFFTVSVYAICPAPALFGIKANVPARSVPWQGFAFATDPVVVTVLVEVIVTVCVTVTVFLLLPRQPPAVSPRTVRTSPAPARRPATRGRP